MKSKSNRYGKTSGRRTTKSKRREVGIRKSCNANMQQQSSPRMVRTNIDKNYHFIEAINKLVRKEKALTAEIN